MRRLSQVRLKVEGSEMRRPVPDRSGLPLTPTPLPRGEGLEARC